MRRKGVGHGHNAHPTLVVSPQDWGVQAEQPAGPPVARPALLLHRREPVLPQYGAYLAWRPVGEGIAGKQRQHVRVVSQQALFGSWNQGVLLPGAQRRKPEIPFKTRLIGRVHPGRPVERLGLETEGISDPDLPVARSPETQSHSGPVSLPQTGHIDWRSEKVPAS